MKRKCYRARKEKFELGARIREEQEEKK